MTAPRIIEIYHRIFVPSQQYSSTINFYTFLLDGTKTLEFSDPLTGLDLAAISSPKLSVLIIAGSDEALAPFQETRLTIKLEKMDQALGQWLRQMGAVEVEGLKETPVGRKCRFRHPDGLLVEYVDHRQ